jgi:hypothetical protein
MCIKEITEKSMATSSNSVSQAQVARDSVNQGIASQDAVNTVSADVDEVNLFTKLIKKSEDAAQAAL